MPLSIYGDVRCWRNDLQTGHKRILLDNLSKSNYMRKNGSRRWWPVQKNGEASARQLETPCLGRVRHYCTRPGATFVFGKMFGVGASVHPGYVSEVCTGERFGHCRLAPVLLHSKSNERPRRSLLSARRRQLPRPGGTGAVMGVKADVNEGNGHSVNSALRATGRRDFDSTLSADPTTNVGGVFEECLRSVQPLLPLPPGFRQEDYLFERFRCTYWAKPAAPPASPARPAVICIHGFGAGAFHWQKMLNIISEAGYDAYALDLLGFGDADMPPPLFTTQGDGKVGSPTFLYTFESWAQQILHFINTVVVTASDTGISQQRDVVLVANSIGCVAALQAACDMLRQSVEHPGMQGTRIRAVMCLNPSLRQLHYKKRRGLRVWTTPLALRVLGFRPVAKFFFSLVSRPATLRRLLCSAYAVDGPEADQIISTELVERIRAPSRRPGALDVFLAFTSYDRGPLAEELVESIAQMAATARKDPPAIWVLWGERDPWEPFALGRELFARNPHVDRFVALKAVGHCPHDQDPNTVWRYVSEMLESVERER
jgi:pimeloyl-ACP methyl ester carboxylesterase